MRFKKGHIPWNTGKPHSKETKQKISRGRLGTSHSLETKNKIAKSHKGKTHSKATRRKMSISRIGISISHSDRTKKKIADSHRGKKHSEETKAKIRESRLKLEHFEVSKGGLHHQNLVTQIAKQYDDGINKVEIEKTIHLPNNHRRIIDILVNDEICIEIGFCKKDKIEELKQHGFKIIHLPYSTFEESHLG